MCSNVTRRTLSTIDNLYVIPVWSVYSKKALNEKKKKLYQNGKSQKVCLLRMNGRALINNYLLILFLIQTVATTTTKAVAIFKQTSTIDLISMFNIKTIFKCNKIFAVMICLFFLLS